MPDSVIRIRVEGVGFARLNRNLAELNQRLAGIQGASTQGTRGLQRVEKNMTRAHRGAQTLAGGMGQLSGKLGILGQSLSLLPGELGAVSAGVQRLSFAMALGRSAAMEYAAIMSLLSKTLAVVAGALAIKAWVDLEDVLIRVRAEAGRLDLSLTGLAHQAMSLRDALDLGLSTTEVAQAARELVKAGLSVEDAFGRAGESVLTFSKVTGIEASQAAEQLVIASFVTGKSFERLSDEIIKAANISKAQFEDITIAFSDAAKAAKDFGLSSEQVAAMAAVASQAGLSGEEAGTAIRRMAQFAGRLRAGTRDVSDTLEVLGRRAQEVTKAFQRGNIGLIEYIDSLFKAGAEQAHLSEIFGQRGVRVIAALRGEIDTLRDWTEQIRGATGETQKLAEAQRGATSVRFQELWENLKVTLLEVGTALAELGIIDLLKASLKLVQLIVLAVRRLVLAVKATRLGFRRLLLEIQGAAARIPGIGGLFGTQEGIEVAKAEVSESLDEAAVDWRTLGKRIEETWNSMLGLSNATEQASRSITRASRQGVEAVGGLTVSTKGAARALDEAVQSLFAFDRALLEVVRSQLKEPQGLRGFIRDLFDAIIVGTEEEPGIAREIQKRVTEMFGGETKMPSFDELIIDPAAALKIEGPDKIARILGGLASAAFVTASNALVSAAASMVEIIAEGMRRQIARAEEVRRRVAIRNVPMLQGGGLITRSGLAEVHAGERIQPARVDRRSIDRRSFAPNITVNVQGEEGRRMGEDIAEQVRRAIRQEWELMLARTGTRREAMEGEV